MAPPPLLTVDGDNLGAPRLARPSEVDQGRGRAAGQRGRRLHEHASPRLGGRASARRLRRFRHGRRAHVSKRAPPQYQSGRDFPKELTDQLDRLPELVEALGFAWAKGAGYEADDFLAAAVAAEEARGGTALVLTNDRDLFQLASPKTTVLQPRRGVSELDRVGPDEVRERYGVDPEQVPDFVALRGDPSDRIPGAPGVGPGRAAAVLKKHGSLDAALQEGGFPTIADDLRRYLRMTRCSTRLRCRIFPTRSQPGSAPPSSWSAGATTRSASG